MRISGNQAFDFTFLDDDLDAQYQQYERWGQIISYTTAFALLIACLGLFGLATLTVARRTKEIGIRKVLGASSKKIVVLLSQDFGNRRGFRHCRFIAVRGVASRPEY